MEYVLRTDKLTKAYGKNIVVDGVSMHVEKGAIYGFIGKNGAASPATIRINVVFPAPFFPINP